MLRTNWLSLSFQFLHSIIEIDKINEWGNRILRRYRLARGIRDCFETLPSRGDTNTHTKLSHMIRNRIKELDFYFYLFRFRICY